MNKTSEYKRLSEMQCDLIAEKLKGKNDNGRCRQCFNQICKKLSTDFLPPLNREDLSAISYSLYEICNCISEKDAIKSDRLSAQINDYKSILDGLFTKKKTCRDEIHRLIDINFNCCEGNEMLNRKLSDLLKLTLEIYFKNL